MGSWGQPLTGVKVLNCIFNDRVAEKYQDGKCHLYWCDYNSEKEIETVIQIYINIKQKDGQINQKNNTKSPIKGLEI